VTPEIQVLRDGPYRVTGVPLVRMRPAVDAEGVKVDWERGDEVPHDDPVDLCRCGRSTTMPFCDGSEQEGEFDGRESASREPYADRSWRFEAGPLVMTDNPSLCSNAAFCEAIGADAWNLAEKASDPAVRERLLGMIRRCPSGRLAYFAPPDERSVEEDLREEIAVVENGPYWVRGGIPVHSADGFQYEVRNRMTLCRCGASRNKPFCDGSHLRTGFRDPPSIAQRSSE